MENRSLLQTYTSSQRPKVNGLPTLPLPADLTIILTSILNQPQTYRIGNDDGNDCFLKLRVMPQKMASALHAPATTTSRSALRREARIFSTCSAVPFVPFSCSDFFFQKREFHVSDEY
jgi:hypothetical protein